jgi:transcriptional regulator with XRE-family HTH domain
MQIKDAIVHLRRSVLQMTQSAFADRIMVDKITISRYENGRMTPGWMTLSRLGRVATDNARHDLATVFLAPIREALDETTAKTAA